MIMEKINDVRTDILNEEDPETKKSFFENIVQKVKDTLSYSIKDGFEILQKLKKTLSKEDFDKAQEQFDDSNMDMEILARKTEEELNIVNEENIIKEDKFESNFIPHIDIADTYNTFERYEQKTTKNDPFLLLKKEDREKLESVIDMDYVINNSQEINSYLERKIRENDVVIAGECHDSDMIEKNIIMNFLEQAKAAGLTDIGLEEDYHLQEGILRYLETGVFEEGENPKDYEKIDEIRNARYEWLNSEENKSELIDRYYNLIEPYEDLYVFRKGIELYYPLVKKAKELGLGVHCLDHWYKISLEEANVLREQGKYDEYDERKMAERDENMFKVINSAIEDHKEGKPNRKMLVILGSLHASNGGLSYESLNDLLKKENRLKTFGIQMDRNLDTGKDFISKRTKKKFPDDRSLNSILFSALDNKGINQIGFDLSEEIVKKEVRGVERKPFLFDGYIKV